METGFYWLSYDRYVEQCEAANDKPLTYDDWKDSQGYRGECDMDNYKD